MVFLKPPETFLFYEMFAHPYKMMVTLPIPQKMTLKSVWKVTQMKVNRIVNWLSKALFQPHELGNPIILEIVKYEEEEGAKGTNRRIHGKHENGKIYQFDIYGDVVNYLVDTLGDDSDLWLGKKIKVLLVMNNGKEVKKVTVI